MPKWTNDQQKAIEEKGTNIIVSAGAGSGKTAVLSERVLEHVKNGMHIDEMLILTFTNAAAAEMKTRIRNKLSKYDNLTEEANKVDIAYITTFDAYALSLVKKYNNLLNIDENVSIIDSSIINLKKKELLEEIFKEKYEENDQNFLKLIDEYTKKDDNTFLQNILDLSNSLDNTYKKDEYLLNYLDNYYKKDSLNNIKDKYILVIKDKINSLKGIIKNLSYYVDDITKFTETFTPLYESNTLEEIYNNSKIICPRLPNGSSIEAKTIKKEIPKLLKEINNLSNKNEEELINEVLSTKENAKEIINIIIELDTKVNNYKKQNNAYEFNDISMMAIDILKQNKQIREELKYTYKEILIDEYQDTNDLQDIFISQIENNNVYMVGDIKQSIYRFRNANPLLFKTKYDSYTKHIDGEKIDLNKNFRSRKEVTEDINLIFNQIMDENIGGANYLESHQMIFGNHAYDNINKENYHMQILNYQKDETYTNEEIEIFTIAKDIKDKINNHFKIMDKDTNKERDITYKDFSILLDRASSFDTYKKIFEYLNIPLMVYRDSSIEDTNMIKLIRNIYNLIIKIANNNYDTSFKYSFMSISRSFLFNIDDNTILETIINNNYKETQIYKIAQNISKDIDEETITEIYDKIIKDFDFYNKLTTLNNIHNEIIVLDSIRNIIKNTEDFGYTVDDFLNFLDDISKENQQIKLSLNKDDSNSVKIMTIHASKGLEYPVCYFAGFTKKFNVDDLKKKFYFSKDYGFILPYNEDNLFTKTLLKEKYMHDEISEKIRLFYVAFTRVREKIIIVAPIEENILSFKENEVIDTRTRLNYRSFKDILDSVEPSLEKYITNINIKELNLSKKYNLTKNIDYHKTLTKTEKLKVIDNQVETNIIENQRFSKDTHQLQTKEQKQNIKLGLEMHEILEHTNFNNPDLKDLDPFKKRKVEKFIKTNILKDSINTYKEYEFIYTKDNKKMHGFIDLLIEFKDHYIIVDYKLKNTQDDAYKKQLKGYKEYIENLTNKKTYTYLYSIIDESLEQINI